MWSREAGLRAAQRLRRPGLCWRALLLRPVVGGLTRSRPADSLLRRLHRASSSTSPSSPTTPSVLPLAAPRLLCLPAHHVPGARQPECSHPLQQGAGLLLLDPLLGTRLQLWHPPSRHRRLQEGSGDHLGADDWCSSRLLSGFYAILIGCDA